MRKFLILISLFFTFLSIAREIPTLTGPVVDELNVIRPEVKASIENALRNFKTTEGIQFQVLLVDNLDGDVIENFAIKVAEKWKIGDEKSDKGAIFILALKERKLRIEVGQGLEGDLTDLQSKRIIKEVGPYFKNQDYESGVVLTLSLMAKATHKELVFSEGTTVSPKHYRNKVSSVKIIIALFILIFVLQFMNPGGRGPRGFGGGGYGGFGGGGGFSGGGGGWSGGGGGFSGGGASGDF